MLEETEPLLEHSDVAAADDDSDAAAASDAVAAAAAAAAAEEEFAAGSAAGATQESAAAAAAAATAPAAAAAAAAAAPCRRRLWPSWSSLTFGAAAAAAIGFVDATKPNSALGSAGRPAAATGKDSPPCRTGKDAHAAAAAAAAAAEEAAAGVLSPRPLVRSRSSETGSNGSSSSSSSMKKSKSAGGALTRAVSFGGNLHRVVSQTLFDGAAAAVLTAAARAETAAAAAAEAVAAAAEHGGASSSSGSESYLSAVSEEEAASGEEGPFNGGGFASPRQLPSGQGDSSSPSDERQAWLGAAAAAAAAGSGAAAGRGVGNSFPEDRSRGSSNGSSSSSSSSTFSFTALARAISSEATTDLPESFERTPAATSHGLQQQQQQQQQVLQRDASRCEAQPLLSLEGGAAAARPTVSPRLRQRSAGPASGSGKDGRSSSSSVSSSSSSSGVGSASSPSAALELANLVSVDCERTQVGICVLHELWAAPLTLALNLLLVYRQIPSAFLYAVAVTGEALHFPSAAAAAAAATGTAAAAQAAPATTAAPAAAAAAAARGARCVFVRGAWASQECVCWCSCGWGTVCVSHRMMSCRDTRVRACRELLLHVRETKVLGWESHAFGRIWSLRLPELRFLSCRYYLHAISNCLFVSTPLVVKVTALTCLVARGEGGGGGATRASSLFAALALIDKALQALNSLPTLMGDLTAAAVALKRLGRCLKPPAAAVQLQLQQQQQLLQQQRQQKERAQKLKRKQQGHAAEPGTSGTDASAETGMPAAAAAGAQAAAEAAAAGIPPDSAVVCFRRAAFAWRPLRPNELLPTSEPCLSPTALAAESPQTGKASVSASSSCPSSSSCANSSSCSSNRSVQQVASILSRAADRPPLAGESKGPYCLRSSSAVLHDADLQINPGELHLVVGKSGSGKSSLLAAVLGDMNLVRGEAYLNLPRPATSSTCSSSSSKGSSSSHSGSGMPQLKALGGQPLEAAAGEGAGSQGLPGSESAAEDPWEFIGFAPQQPVIFEGTLRSNILMGRPLLPLAYSQVLHACCLERDLAALGGDSTPIDAGGHRLSGGQRARICLARAFYSAAAVAACCRPPSSGQQKASAASQASASSGESTAAAAAAAAAASARQLADNKLTRLATVGKRALYLIDDPFSPLDAVTAMAVWRRVFAPGGMLDKNSSILASSN
ncbi:LOW QUALITY PROTEIN: ABC transporter, putative [Eimeria necatrix]|uniref:ABC transporter, putative n=1 Tax=Eimeria necatrix TaxID=51315 RepID=U6MLD5_9EIME|nr:LOW QUALITY PROTEIN: ABC transporter, putative [Eimeria necatrix]CDJ64826.1 ABC transporter, putative [Eimeria necatrix]